MIKNIFIPLLIAFAYSGCKKGLPGDADTLAGSWYIKSIHGVNGFSGTTGLDFTTGKFTFNKDGSLIYLDAIQQVYNGRWSLNTIKDQDCYTDNSGNQVCNTTAVTVLQLDANRLPAGQETKTAHFVSFKLTDANNFTALLSPGGLATHQYSFGRAN